MSWYTGNATYDSLLIAGFIMALLVFLSSQMGTAQYGGRFGAKGGGLKLGSKTGWILMEIPALIAFPVFFFMGSNATQAVPLFFLGLWVFHYLNRAIVTPMLMRTAEGSSNSFAIGVIFAGWVTLVLHSYLNAYYIVELGSHYDDSWFQDPRFILGVIIYIIGFNINVKSDSILRNLRSKKPKSDETRYKIPYGGLFKWVTCPQYFGEILSFAGLAVMTWNLGAVFVLAITIGNLVPRAMVTHRWFLKNFDDYPSNRKAIIPYIY